jgi:hypothetical protein
MNDLDYLKEIAATFPTNQRRDILLKTWTMRTCLAASRLLVDGKAVAESGIESCFLMAAEILALFGALIVQPFTMLVGPDGFSYTPDAIVKTVRGVFVVECKPSRSAFDPEFRAWATAVRMELAKRGIGFIVVDEHDVCGWELVRNLGHLWRVKDARALDEAAARAHRVVMGQGGVCTVARVRRAGLSDFEIRRAIAQGLLYCDLHRDIDRRTPLRLKPFGDRRDLLSKFSVSWEQMNLAPAPPLQLLPSYRVEPTRPSARAVSVCVANTVEA